MEIIDLAYKNYSVTVYHKKGDTGEKLVFLHGGGLDNAMMSWKEVIELMGDKYDIYAIDMLGYGKSDRPDILYTISMYEEFLYDILKQLHIDRACLIGLSLGGGISIDFSLKFPDMVDKLVFIDSYGLSEKMPFHKLCRWIVNSSLNSKSYEWFRKSKKLIKLDISASFIGDKNKITDEMINTLHNILSEPNADKPFGSFQRYELGRDKLTTCFLSRLNELKMPVLIVNGEKDSLVPVKSAIAAGKLIENCQLHIMKGCKHWAQKERPEEFVQVLKAFLEK